MAERAARFWRWVGRFQRDVGVNRFPLPSLAMKRAVAGSGGAGKGMLECAVER